MARKQNSFYHNKAITRIRPNLFFISCIPILLLLFFTHCKKSNSVQEKEPVRIKTVYYYWTGQSTSKVVDSNTYMNNRLSETYTYEDHGTLHSDPSSKITYTYSGNEIIVSLYYLSVQGAVLRNRRTYVINNGQIISMLYEPVSNAGSEAKVKVVYEYNGNHLIRETHSVSYFNDTWESENKKEFYYGNNLVDSIIEYSPIGINNWKTTGKQEFEYLGEKINRLVHFSYSSNIYIQDKLTQYIYSGEKVISIGSDNSLEAFQYDGYGNLKSHDDDNPYFPRKTFQYEAGTGNYALIKYIGDPLSKFEQYPCSVCIP